MKFEYQKEILELHEYFSTLTNSSIMPDIFMDLFIKIFCITYLKDIDGYYSNNKVARSNWTQHTANTFFRTSQMLNIKCDFEVENRHDGAIRDNLGRLFLAAEWEYDTQSIFNPKGELYKLYNTSKKHNCPTFLFTYSLDSSYKKFIEQVYNYWQKVSKTKEVNEIYIVTALFEEKEIEKVRYMYRLRTAVIGKNNIEFWEDA